MDRIPLSIIILARNEEENLPDCLRSAEFAGQILLIDSGSTDKTLDIALSYGAEIRQRPLNNDYASQRNFAIQEAKHDWIFMLDADERITHQLKVEIIKAITTNENVCYQVSRENHFIEGKVLHGVLRPDKVERLFKKNNVVYEGCVHERVRTDKPKKKLSGRLIHFPYKTWESHLEKMNKYTTLLAHKYYERNKKCSFVSGVILKPIWAFVKTYFIHLGFLDGKLGFEFCLLHSFYTLEKYLKLRALKNNRGRI